MANRRRTTYTHSDSNRHGYTDSHSYRNTYRHGYGNTNRDSDCDTDCHGNGHTYRHRKSCCDTYSYSFCHAQDRPHSGPGAELIHATPSGYGR